MWRYYLGTADPTAGSRSRAAVRSGGHPPALITCAEIDPFRDEAVHYARALLRAGAPAELHVFAGTCHGFDSLLPDWSESRRLYALQGDALRRAFA